MAASVKAGLRAVWRGVLRAGMSVEPVRRLVDERVLGAPQQQDRRPDRASVARR